MRQTLGIPCICEGSCVACEAKGEQKGASCEPVTRPAVFRVPPEPVQARFGCLGAVSEFCGSFALDSARSRGMTVHGWISRCFASEADIGRCHSVSPGHLEDFRLLIFMTPEKWMRRENSLPFTEANPTVPVRLVRRSIKSRRRSQMVSNCCHDTWRLTTCGGFPSINITLFQDASYYGPLGSPVFQPSRAP